MTSLNPSHFPVQNDNPRQGMATISSISPLRALAQHSPEEETNHAEADASHDEAGPSWKGAWARRQAAKTEEKDDRIAATRRRGRIPTPQIPDLRYEQGILASLRPFIHSGEASAKPKLSEKGKEGEEEKAEELESREKGAMVTAALTAEGGDIFAAPVRLEYGQITYVLFRDQIVWPLLQGKSGTSLPGMLWGVGGYLISYAWNRHKSAAPPSTRRSDKGTSTLAVLSKRLGLSSR